MQQVADSGALWVYLLATLFFTNMVACVRCMFVDRAGGSPGVRHESRQMSHMWGVVGLTASSAPAGLWGMHM